MTAGNSLKIYLRNEMVNKRAELGITQEKMAENLNISLRSYANLENGKYCCSLTTFISYVNHCDVDTNKLLSDMAEILDDCDNEKRKIY